MVSNDIIARHRAFLPWGTEGLAGLIVPRAAPSTHVTPSEHRRAEVTVRVLPGDAVQVLSPSTYGARVVRMSPTRRKVDIRTAGWIVDAVLLDTGDAVVLEQDGRSFTVRHVARDGTTSWSAADIPATTKSRLLADKRGRVVLSSEDALMRVDDRSMDLLADSRPGPETVMYPDGRVGFVSYDPARYVRDWVVRDLATGTESVTAGTDENWVILQRPIGVDENGAVYGDSPYSFGRMTSYGEVDWQISLGGVAVSERYGLAMLCLYEDDSGVLVRGTGEIVTEISPEENTGWLVGRTEDGEFILHEPAQDGPGELRYLNPQGQLTRREPAGSEVMVRFGVTGRPAASSVTQQGELLIPVLTNGGVHIVALSPRRRGR